MTWRTSCSSTRRTSGSSRHDGVGRSRLLGLTLARRCTSPELVYAAPTIRSRHAAAPAACMCSARTASPTSCAGQRPVTGQFAGVAEAVALAVSAALTPPVARNIDPMKANSCTADRRCHVHTLGRGDDAVPVAQRLEARPVLCLLLSQPTHRANRAANPAARLPAPTRAPDCVQRRARRAASAGHQHRQT